MNERIRELADQCRTEYRDGHGSFIEQFDEEKFAELIVRNCIDEMVEQMLHHGIDESNNPSFYKAIEKTIEQFGIKQ